MPPFSALSVRLLHPTGHSIGQIHCQPRSTLHPCRRAVGLTTFIATQPAFHRSFCLRENMADISAKTQAQQMVMDNLGLATAVGLNYLCRHTGGWVGGRAGGRVMGALFAGGQAAGRRATQTGWGHGSGISSKRRGMKSMPSASRVICC